jgi:DNA-binding CsgD family transcriptional regulator
LGDAAACESTHEMVAAVMPPMQALFSAELVIFDLLDEQMQQLGFQLCPPQPPELIARAHPPFVAHFHEHPFKHDWVQTVGRGRVSVLSDRISNRKFRRTAFFNEAFIHLRGKNQLMIGGQIEDSRYWNFSCLRLGSDFSPRDREIARYLQPPLARLFSQLARRDRASHAISALANANAAYLVVDPQGRLLEVSQQARVLLTQSGRDHRPMIAAHVAGAPGAGISTASFGELQALVYRAATNGQAFVMLQPSLRPALTDAHQLTRRETEIFQWLSQGKTNREIAAILGLSTRTVEKHCERLFTKLGVENRVAAAQLAW